MNILPQDFGLAESDVGFLLEQFGGLTTERKLRKITEWATEKRYLPPELTSHPGKYDLSYAPYLNEIMDVLSPSDPTRKCVVMKGVQICATTGILENFLGYSIDEDPCGMMYISADKDLTKLGMELKIDRMLYHSGLSHLLQPGGSNKTKRTGDTASLKEFVNGFLLAVGARNAAKLRSTAVKKAALDEVDGMPRIVGGVGNEEGSPVGLVEARTAAYESSRKLLYMSTPLKTQTSMILPLYKRGDQRKYFIPCPHCGFYQVLDWHGYTKAGKRYGITFDLDSDNILIEASVGYICCECSAIFRNHHKETFLGLGEWRPTARTQEVGLVSFHLPAFLSPVGMQSWTAIVYQWMNAWDVVNDRTKDIDELQRFYNLIRGLPFEERGESPSAERVREHKRIYYQNGEIPNTKIVEETGAPAVFLTCAADVHGDRLDVEVVAWAQNRQSWSIEWLKLEGTPDDPSTEGYWAALSELIENREWVADDGRRYQIRGTLVDAGYRSDNVYEFCKLYTGGVFPVMGRNRPMRDSLLKEFQLSESATGLPLINCTASLYKDRLSSWLKAEWKEGRFQPTGYPNFPENRRDDYFAQYEAEKKVEILQKRTRKRIGFEWKQIGQRPNHAWDCRVYNMCCFDMIVQDVCIDVLGLENLDYIAFFEYATPQKNSLGKWLPNDFSYHPDQA